MEALKKGTVQSLLVALRDRLNNIDDLATDVSSLRFDTKKKSDMTACESNKLCAVDSDYPMTAICEIDTTNVNYVVQQEYALYIKFTAGTENPVLGPVYFRVEDD